MKKHTIAKSFSIYGKLLKKAWATTWKHKELWFFGLLSGFAYSGTILQNILESLVRVRPADNITVESIQNASPVLDYFIIYGQKFVTLSSERLTLMIIAIVILGLFVAFLILSAQHILLNTLHRAATRKKHIGWSEFLAARKHIHVLRLFAVNATSYIVTAIVTFGASIPLLYLLTDSYTTNFFVYLGIYLVLLPILFIVNILTIFTLIHVVRKDDSLHNAVKRACRVVRSHWLVVTEMALILFLINLGTFIAFFAIISFAAAIILPIFLAATAAGSTLAASAIGIGGGLIGGLLYLFYFGVISTFNYAAWTEMAERVERFNILPALEAVFAKLRS